MSQSFINDAPVYSGYTPPKTTYFTASGTFTPSPGMLYCMIEVISGGGGGGGCTSLINAYGAGAGGSGSYSRKQATAAEIGASQTVTVGAAGIAGTSSGTNGGAGGNSSVGTLCTSIGGSGGTGIASTIAGAPGAGGNTGIGDFVVSGNSGAPGSGYPSISTYLVQASGGQSYFGGKPLERVSAGATIGESALGKGSGGNGASSFNSSGAKAGGAGRIGIVIITEFFQLNTYGELLTFAGTGDSLKGSFATQADQETGTATGAVVTPSVQQYHQSSSKCWLAGYYTGGTPTIDASYGISSLTDNAVGNVTVNLSVTFSSGSWASVVSGGLNIGSSFYTFAGQAATNTTTTTQMTFTTATNVLSDVQFFNFAGYGDL